MHSAASWIVQAFQARGAGIPALQRADGWNVWASRDLVARIRPERLAGLADAEMRAAWRIFEAANAARPRGVEIGHHSVASFWERLHPDRPATPWEAGQWLRHLHDTGDASGLPAASTCGLHAPDGGWAAGQDALARRAADCIAELGAAAGILLALPHVLIHGAPGRDALVRVGTSVTGAQCSRSGAGPRAWDVAYAISKAWEAGEPAADVLAGYGPHREVTGRQLEAATSFIERGLAWPPLASTAPNG